MMFNQPNLRIRIRQCLCVILSGFTLINLNGLLSHFVCLADMILFIRAWNHLFLALQVGLAAPASITAAFEVNFRRHYPSKRIAVSFNLLRKKWMLSSSSSVADLADDEVDNWDLCRQALSCFNFDTEEIDKILGKAFGHIHSPYWGEERAKEVPKYVTVNAILNYLRSLTLTNEDLSKILKKFPEVLGCNLNDEVRNNVMVLEKEWGITGKSLRNLLLRNPKVLGYNVDCKGSCVAQCTRCWVRF